MLSQGTMKRSDPMDEKQFGEQNLWWNVSYQFISSLLKDYRYQAFHTKNFS